MSSSSILWSRVRVEREAVRDRVESGARPEHL